MIMDSGNSSSGGGCGDNEEYDSSRGGEGDDPISDYFIDHFESNAGSQLFLSLPPTLSSPYFNNNHDLIGPGPGHSLTGLLCGASEPGFGTGFPDLVPNTAPSSSPIIIGARQQNGHFLDPSSSAQPTVENPGPGSGSAAPKNTKKRSRASRRAPTTVLATDTANFRQMVQEYTGIPAAPFSRRLDLFSSAASGSALMRPAHFDGPPPPPLRPSSSAAQSSGFLFNTGSGSNPSTTNNLGIRTQDEPDLFQHPILRSGNQEPIHKSNHTEDQSS